MVFTVSDMCFKAGMELCISGRLKPDCIQFSINIGHDYENIACHFNPRFNYSDDVKTIVCNSKCDGWCEEQRSTIFPFQKGQEFKVRFSFSHDTFYVKLTDGNTIEFPNRFGEDTFRFLFVKEDATITNLKLT